jgi:hypothetical protein
MPIFEVEVVDTYDQTVEEVWHAYRSLSRYNLYRIEAESEEEAEELVGQGEGTLIEENEDIGETYDSDHWADGGIVNEELVERNVDVVPPRPAQGGIVGGGVVGVWPGRFVGSVPTVSQQREPDWEV